MSLSAFPSSYSPLFPLHCPCSVLLAASLYPALSPSPGLAPSISACLLYPSHPRPSLHTQTHARTHPLISLPLCILLFLSFLPLTPSFSLTFCTRGITCFRAFSRTLRVYLQSELHQTFISKHSSNNTIHIPTKSWSYLHSCAHTHTDA